MFGHAAPMQLSAANLLIASQQVTRGAHQPPPPHAQAQFASALAKESGAAPAGFEAMDFKQTAPAAKPLPAPAAQPPAAGYNAAAPVGGNLDIRI